MLPAAHRSTNRDVTSSLFLEVLWFGGSNGNHPVENLLQLSPDSFWWTWLSME